MPQVPTYDDFHATPSAGGFTPVSSGFNAQAANADQLQRLGGTMQGVGSEFARIAVDMQQVQNQARVNDAVNKARVAVQNLTIDPEVGFAAQRGLNALQRASGQALPEEYGGKLSEHLSTLSAGLANDEQRRLFSQTAGSLTTQFHGDVEQHMMREATNYRVGVNDATIDLAGNDAKTYWNDPDKVNAAIGAMQAATVEKMHTLGMQGAPTDAALLTQTSKVHTGVIMSALENNNPQYALGYLDRNKASMSADDILRVQGHVNQQVWAGQAMGAVSATTQAFQSKVQPTSFDQMVGITVRSESGGNPNAQGPMIPGQGTAKGLMQVMDATAASPGYGIRPAAVGADGKVDPADRARVGREYLQALLQQYGDPAKAWAAYNAGPKTLDKALKDAGAGGGWLAAMAAHQSPDNHAQTVAYVNRNVAALGNAPGSNPKPIESDFVNDALGRLPPGAPPQVVKITRDQAVAQFGIITKSINEQSDNAVKAAQQWVVQNATSGAGVDQMPAGIRDQVSRFAPDKFVELEKLSKSLQRGDVVTNLGQFNDIVSNMGTYAKLSDTTWNQMQTVLSPGDFKSLSKERATYQNGEADTSYQSIDTASVNQALKSRLAGLQIPATPKSSDVAGRERLGGIQQYVRAEILLQQQQAGRKFKPAEVEETMDKIFAQDATFKTSFFGIPTGSDVKPLMSMVFGDIPGGDADKIKARLVSEGKTSPTNNDVLNRYRAVKAARGG